MRLIAWLSVTAIVLWLGLVPASAQVRQTGDPAIDQLLDEALANSFLTVEVPLPIIRPQLVELKHGTVQMDTEMLIKKFFGGRQNIMSEEDITSPRWGQGKRYKSGMVFYVGTKAIAQLQDIAGAAKEIEMVPTFLDVYPNGFVYANNIGHTPVYATDVKVQDPDKPDVSYYKVFDEQEGQLAVEKLLDDMFGGLKVPDGFQPSVKVAIQRTGERLFAYHANLEYITSYNVYDYKHISKDVAPEQTLVGTQPMSVPVYDAQVNVIMDGSKVLAGMEYFWDGGITVVGQPQECQYAVEALTTAREALFKEYNQNPPLFSIANIQLGYVEDRQSPSRYVPVWLFDAWYYERVGQPEDARPAADAAARNLVPVPHPLAVNALTSEMVRLVN